MKIQQIQNYNTNFQGLHGNKRILKKLTPEILQKTGIQECADSFEVLVTPKKSCTVSCFLVNSLQIEILRSPRAS